MLNVSQPTFIKLLNEDTIPYTRTGNRRKVKFSDVKAYKDNLEQQRLTTLKELSELDQSLSLG